MVAGRSSRRSVVFEHCDPVVVCQSCPHFGVCVRCFCSLVHGRSPAPGPWHTGVPATVPSSCCIPKLGEPGCVRFKASLRERARNSFHKLKSIVYYSSRGWKRTGEKKLQPATIFRTVVVACHQMRRAFCFCAPWGSSPVTGTVGPFQA